MSKFITSQKTTDVRTLIGQLKADPGYETEIDICPEYQRDVVWDHEKKSNHIKNQKVVRIQMQKSPKRKRQQKNKK